MKDIPKYQKLYAVTENGRVWSYRKNDFLIPTLNEQGYYKVTLFDNNDKKRCIYIHKLVALTYIPIPQSEEELTVDHIDRNKTNNTVSNLRWVTRSVQNQNQNKNWTEKMQLSVEKAAKSHSHPVEQRDKNNHNILINSFNSCTEAAIKLFNDSSKNSLINRCAQGRKKSAYGYWWKFVEK